MTPRTVRAVRRGLLAAIVLIAALVLLNLRRRGAPAAAPAPELSLAQAPPRGAQVAKGFHYEQQKGEQLSLVLDADSMVGQEHEEVRLQGVRARFPYVARGQSGSATITSDECGYTPAAQKASFRGHVVVRTADGAELRAESLVYRGDKGVARTESPVEFARKRLSGRSTGMVYQSETGTLELEAEVSVRIEGAGPALEIRAASAVADREAGTLRFEGGSEARQGEDLLTSEELVVAFHTEEEELAGFTAAGRVELRSSGGSVLPGMAAVGGESQGRRLLTCQRLDVSYRGGRTLEQATAGPDAELTIFPGPGEPQERHRLGARVLSFRFDEQGRLAEIQGLKDASLVTEPLAPAAGTARSARCRRFVARLDPAIGEVRTIDLVNDVEVTRGTQRARSGRGFYDGSNHELVLDEQPELKDARDDSRLSAQRIAIGTRSGDIAAFGDVNHTLGRNRSGRPGGLLGGSEAPTIVACRRFHYRADAEEARYQEEALLRSSKDEIRAPEIVIRSEAGGGRRLDAGGGVVSLFHPRGEAGQPPPAVVETRAQKLAYDEALRRAVYDGEVLIRQGDLGSRSPSATVTLTADGSAIQTLVAGEPVEIEQGPRKANGTTATYTPASQVVVVVGAPVVLTDPGQQIQGRSLTFHVGDDRILVDGREEVRTETILKKEPPTP